MKGLLIALLFLLVTGNILHAQKLPIQLGIKGGLNVSNFGADHIVKSNEGFSSITGVQAGAFASAKLSSHWSLQAELLWNQLGNNSKMIVATEDTTYFVKYKTRLNYLSLPILAQYKLLPGLFIYAGPQISYLLSAKGSSEAREGSGDITPIFKRSDIAAIGGAQYQIPHTPLIVSARYQWGITKTVKGEGAPSQKNVAGSFTIGYKIF